MGRNYHIIFKNVNEFIQITIFHKVSIFNINIIIGL